MESQYLTHYFNNHSLNYSLLAIYKSHYKRGCPHRQPLLLPTKPPISTLSASEPLMTPKLFHLFYIRLLSSSPFFSIDMTIESLHPSTISPHPSTSPLPFTSFLKIWKWQSAEPEERLSTPHTFPRHISHQQPQLSILNRKIFLYNFNPLFDSEQTLIMYNIFICVNFTPYEYFITKLARWMKIIS